MIGNVLYMILLLCLVHLLVKSTTRMYNRKPISHNDTNICLIRLPKEPILIKGSELSVISTSTVHMLVDDSKVLKGSSNLYSLL